MIVYHVVIPKRPGTLTDYHILSTHNSWPLAAVALKAFAAAGPVPGLAIVGPAPRDEA